MDSEERQLSDRERTVLLLAAEGLTDKEIARHLDLSQRTIGTYWERMRQKLGPFSRTQLVARFLRLEGDHENSNQNYRELFSTWDEGVLIFSPEGATIFANQAIATLLGLSLDQVQTGSVQDLFKQAASEEIRAFVNRLATAHETIERQVIRSNGHVLWLYLRGGPISDRRGRKSAVVLMVRDITLQKRVSHTLDTCQSTLQFIAENSSDFIVRFDDQMKCVSANSSCRNSLGIELKDVEGKSIREVKELCKPNDAWLGAMETAFSTGDIQDFRSQWPDGVERTTNVMPEPDSGFVPRFVLTITRK